MLRQKIFTLSIMIIAIMCRLSYADEVIENSDFTAFNGKRIGVSTGSAHVDIVREKLPDSEIVYLEVLANMIQALKSGKIDALTLDEPVAIEILRENPELEIINGKLQMLHDAFILPKHSRNEKLYSELNDYIKRIQSDGTSDKLLSIWTGHDDSLKVIPDYTKLPDTNGTLRLAVDTENPPFIYVSNGKLAGYDIDVIVRFCMDKGYRPEFQVMNFAGIIPSVLNGRSDMSAVTFTITPERAESVRFSEPLYSFGVVLVALKSSRNSQEIISKNPVKYSERIPKYKSIAELDGKPIGVQTGVDEWAKFVSKHLPNSEIVYYDTFADIAAALKSKKIEAFLIDEPVFNYMAAEDNNLARIDEKIDDTYDIAYGFPKTEKGRTLCDEMSEYIRSLKESGELDAIIAKWEGADESAKTIPDYKNFPAPKGVLTMATEGEYPPFNYYIGNEITGFEIDMAARFCEAKGYGLKVASMAWYGIINALASGKYDFAGAYLAPAEEHSGQIFFSEPYIQGRSLMICLKSSDTPEMTVKYTKLSDLAGRKVGIILGANHDTFASEKIPDVKIEYFNDLSAVTLALQTGKIDAFANTLPTAIYMTHERKDISYVSEPLEITNTYSAFTNSEKGRKICAEYAEFVKSLWENGTIKQLADKWIYSEDESRRTIEDYSKLPAGNGVLKMVVDTGRMPFAYVKDNKITGYDIELAAMFCKAKGYGLEVYSMNFAGILGSIKTGQCDLTGSITRTEERAETMLFSPVPNAETPIVLLVMKNKNTDSQRYSGNLKLSDFEDKKIGVQIGTTCEKLVPERFPSAQVSVYNSITDALTALMTGKINAMCCALPSAVYVMNEHTDLEIVEPYLRESYLYSIFVNSDRGEKLCGEYSDFLKTLWDNGTIDEIADIWLGADESKKTVEDYSELPAINGTVKMAVDTSIVPFAYIKDNKIVGHAVDLAVRFCKAKGYALEISDMSLSAVIASVKAGKCDFTQAMTKTKEREENTLFATSPSIKSGNVLLIMKSSPQTTESSVSPSQTENEPSFIEDIAASFERTFIRESRWKLFADGIMNTMIITVMSIFCGMLLGFTVFMLCRTGNRTAIALTKFSVWLIKGTPIVVLLMILYYVIFGHVNISGIVVAIIAFTLTFGTSVYRMLTFGTGAVDRGQTEAAYALGFTDMQTFFTVILPQAALHFMPSFKEEVTMLIKSTSVVGYIAVQDLTKMGDIVRSRTYEAFFPLIAVAVIYFIMAGILNIIVNIIHVRITPSKRKPEDILRGINTSGGM